MLNLACSPWPARAALIALLLLTACGGGGDDVVASAPSASVPVSTGTDDPRRKRIAAISKTAGSDEVSAETMAHGVEVHADPLTLLQPRVSTSNPSQARLESGWASMSIPNEILPKGMAPTAAWRHGANVNMGTEPYGDAIPHWWTPGIRFAEWHAMSSWFVVYPDDMATPVTNTVVEVSGMEMWVLRSSVGFWQRMQSGIVPTWQGNYRLGGGGRLGPASYQTSPTGSRLYRPGVDYMVHAGLGQVSVPWRNDLGADVQAVYVSVRHRLSLRDPLGVDDRATAKFGVAVGVDYFPWLGATLQDMEANYVPSAGVGQFQASTSEWRYAAILITKEGMNESEVYQPRPPAFRY